MMARYQHPYIEMGAHFTIQESKNEKLFDVNREKSDFKK